MKKTLIPILLFSATFANAQDMSLQTRIDQGTFDSLIHRSRAILKNTKIGDILKDEINLEQDILIAVDELKTSSKYKKLRDVFSSVFKMDMKNAKIRIRIPKIGYEVENISINPLDLQVNDPTLELQVEATALGLKASLPEGLAIDLLLPDPKTQKDESYLTASLNPVRFDLPEGAEPFAFDVRFETIRDQGFSFNLKDYNLNKIQGFVQNNMNAFNIMDTKTNAALSADSLQVNPIIVRLNTMSRSVTFDSFKPILQERLDSILANVFTKVGNRLKNAIGPRILKNIFSNKSKSSLIIENKSIYSRLSTTSFSEPSQGQLRFAIAGEVCTSDSYQLTGASCGQESLAFQPIRKIPEEHQSLSQEEVSTSLARGESDLVLSISEEFINRVLNTTIQGKLWDKILEQKNLKLGPKGIFIILNKNTSNPELYLDLLYLGDGKGIKKYLINENKPLRFPIRISTALGFKSTDGVPHLVIETKQVLSTRDELINGISEYGLESKLIRGFKKKVAKMILEMTAEINGKQAIDLELPILKDSNIEQTRIESSAHGKLNLYFKF